MTSVFLFSRLLAMLDAAYLRMRCAAEQRRAHEAFNRLDDATLRDLGLSRGEFTSCWLESRGSVPHTRRQVTVDPTAP